MSNEIWGHGADATSKSMILMLHGRRDPDFHLKKKTSRVSKLNKKLCSIILWGGESRNLGHRQF